MAAITPHLEEQNDASESREEKAYFKHRHPRGRGRGLGALQQDKPGSEHAGLEAAAVQVAHSNLISTAWTRRAIEEALVGRTITVTQQGRNAVLLLDAPIGPVPKFNPPGEGKNRKASVLSWTSKMGCPSFSLPAGPTMFGGSCLGALAGQSIVPVAQLTSASKRVQAITGEPVVLADAVCEWCYAESGNYRYGTKQLSQIILYAWTRKAVADGSFVEVLDWAVKNANYEQKKNLPAERHAGRFFRLHDSGDFFSMEYLRAWKEIANRNPDITFWAPTRIWAVGGGVEMVNQINRVPGNFVIRPSTYMIDRPPPQHLGPGWAGWTTVFDKSKKPSGGPFFGPGEAPYNWDCQTYAVENEAHTCRHALAPDGKKGCRTCWIHPELAVNYTKH